MNILETAQDLVDKGLKVSVGKRLSRTNNCGKIAFHQLCEIKQKLISYLTLYKMRNFLCLTNLHKDMSR